MKPSATAGGLARLQGAIPLLVVYFALAALYAWQASRRPVPTIFTDELELTQLSRAIAETGEPARRGEPYGFATLVAYFLAPAWWLGSVAAAYAAAKLMLVLAMTATLFPAYALARLVVTPWYALAAATGATIVPALAYSPILVEEPLAYPLSTLALWLIARALIEPRWTRVGLALAASAAAVWTRTQLAVLFAVLLLGLVWLVWDSERARRWRSSWSGWDWAGAVVLVVGVVLAFSAAMGHASKSWRDTTGFYKDRLLEHGTWAMGALAIGIGIIPLLIGVSALARPRDEPRDRNTQAFVAMSVLALVTFVWYAAIKGAYLSTTFSTLVVERNVIYLYPILFAATALAFARGVGRGWAVAVVAVVTVYLVVETPLRLDTWPYYEAHGLSMPAFMNRELGWAEGRIETALVIVCIAALAVAVALRVFDRGSTAFRAVAATAAVGVLAWTLTTEVYAAQAERDLSQRVSENLLEPYDWVERATGGSSVVVLGQQISDATGVQLTEFFNPSIKKMWSLDGSAIHVGSPILTPDLEAADGTLTPNPGTEYALALNGVELQGPVVARQGRDALYRVDGQPLKLAAAIVGQEQDGWLIGSAEDPVARGSYTRYRVSDDGPGFVIVKLSRLGWCPKPPRSTRATVRIGTVGIGPDKQPAIGSVIDTKRVVIDDCTTTPVTFALPRVPWRLEVAVSPTVVPREVDPSNSESRRLGATFSVDIVPLFEGS
jgi:hypothetical protein